MSLSINHFVEEATCHSQQSCKMRTQSLTYKTTTTFVWDGWFLFLLLYFQRLKVKFSRTWKLPHRNSLNFTWIDFPTPFSQIDKLEKQILNLAMNVFGGENGRVIVHRISERVGTIPAANKLDAYPAKREHARTLLESLLRASSVFLGSCISCISTHLTCVFFYRRCFQHHIETKWSKFEANAEVD